MAGLYVDTSALGRIPLAEPDAAAIRSTLARNDAAVEAPGADA